MYRSTERDMILKHVNSLNVPDTATFKNLLTYQNFTFGDDIFRV